MIIFRYEANISRNPGLSPPQRPIALAAFAFAVINYFVAALMQDEKDTRNADEMALRRRKSILT